MQAKLSEIERASREPIAIIGLGCRFADATTPEAFWRILRDGVDAITEIPKERWDIDAYYDPDPDAPGKMYVRHGSFIKDIDQFDPLFFGISPREADLMDPQQRLLLEVAWEAIERAGIAPHSLRGSATGVYVGMMSQDYAELSNQAGIIEPHSGPGNGYGMAAGRISHVLGLQGPNLSLDTQCSSSLVAVHLAVASLRNHECNLALAGGVNLILAPTNTMKYCRTRAYAPDGRCKTFAARADGMISSEGCGLVLLKRLSDAIAVGDPILAVIRGSATNHDGASSGYTVPSQLAQEALLRLALANAQLTPDQIDYIEAHGTGTTLGDPIELNALSSVFGQRLRPLLLGSAKTNLGHTDSAAGIAGLIKTVLALRHRAIPPHLHFEQPTSHIPWHRLPFQVPTRLTPWPNAVSGHKRLAGISSFGMSGTNAHVIVEEWNPAEPQIAQGRQGEPQLLTLSAKSPVALAALAGRYSLWLPDQPETALADICFTSQIGRTHYTHRLAAVGKSTAELAGKLAAFVQGSSDTVTIGVATPNTNNANSTRLSPNGSDRELQLTELGEQYVRGVEIDWADIHRDNEPAARRRRADLPTYPFQRQRYWLPDAEIRPIRIDTGEKPLHPLLQKTMLSPLRQEIIFETCLDTAAFPFLADYLVFGEIVISGAISLSMVLSAAEAITDEYASLLTDVAFVKPIVLPADQAINLQLILTLANKQASRSAVDSLIPFQIISFSSTMPLTMNNVATHVSGNILSVASSQLAPWIDPLAFKMRCHQQVTAAEFYANLKQCFHTSLGPSWQWIQAIWQTGGEALGQIHAPSDINDPQGYSLHPCLLGALLYLAGATTNDPTDEESSQPVAIEKVCLYRHPKTETLWAYVRRTGEQQWEMQLLDQAGQVIAEVMGLEAVKMTHSQLLDRATWENWLYGLTWPEQAFSLHGYLPTPHEVCVQLPPQLRVGLDQERLATYYNAIAGLEAVSADFATHALQQLGFTFQPKAHWQSHRIAQSLRVVQHYEQLLIRLLAILAEEGILRQLPDGDWEVIRTPSVDQLPTLMDSLSNANPLVAVESALLKRCAGMLAAVLQGSHDPLQLLFPNGDTHLATQLYQYSTQAKATSAIVVQAVRQLLSQRASGQSLRILEIGGGTGGTTAHVLPVLSAGQAEYVFTDISPLFVAQAEEKFDTYPFVRYARLDIEQDPAAQGFQPGQYDVVVAANVLHATLDLRCSLQHVRQLLAPGGMLILVEETQRQRWVDLTFGLTDGWWRFQDFDLRPDYPLLGVEAWQSLLDSVGFKEACSLTAAAGLTCSEQVLLAQAQSAAKLQGRWLIFADADGVGAALAVHLAGQGGEPILVQPGEGYRQIDARRFQINPGNPTDYPRLLEDAPDLVGVLHLWSLDTAAELSIESIHDAARRGCHTVLSLVQALVERGLSPRLWLVTRDVVDAVYADSDLSGVAQAPLWGMGKTIGLEHPELRMALVDLDAKTPAVDALLAELGNNGDEDQIAWRAGVRHVARLAPRKPRQTTAASSQSITIQGEATYLISGGLGGLGLLVAGFLIDQGAHHLVLLGRSAASASALTQIQAWEAKGVTVQTVQADVADADQIARLTAQIDTAYPLRGVIHAAGALDDGILLQQTPARFDHVMAAKVDGAWNLHQSTLGHDLDFFVLFSSNASLLGSAGQANHAAANQFLDAFAAYRQRLGLPALSINWGVWSEVGAAATRLDQISLVGEQSISPTTGIQIFAELLHESAAQIAVLPVDNWTLFQQNLPPDRQLPLLRELTRLSAERPTSTAKPETKQESTNLQDLPTRLAAADATARQMMLEGYLRDCLRRVLNLNSKIELSPDQSWTELGMDSLLGIELSNRIKRETGVKVAISQLLDQPTIQRVAQLMLEYFTLQQIHLNKTASPATHDEDEMEEMIL